MTPFDDIKNCIKENKSFVLQGGAGSGKTETLKQTLHYIFETYPEKKVVCITHTNSAVDEIKSRVGSHFLVSTIHSLLSSLITDYKKNLHQVFHKLFEIPLLERKCIDHYGGDTTKQKKEEHAKYKKLYTKYATTFNIANNQHVGKVEGKREYDKTPEVFNETLNRNIVELNDQLQDIIRANDFRKITYNETRFNSLHGLSFGHDGLIDISSFLFKKYPLVGKIVQDQFDCILIDEYQDTRKETIDLFLNLPVKDKTLVGLFGDSMQAIYEDGIGNVNEYVDNEILIKINKEDNYRCSEQVISFINQLRNDKLEQKVALKRKKDGSLETIEDRQGKVILYYSFYLDKPHARSPQDEKEAYLQAIENLVNKASDEGLFRQLKLTNKSIAMNAGFGQLYDIFSRRFLEPIEHIEKHLSILQFTALFELMAAYKPIDGSRPNYNKVLSGLKKYGFSLQKLSDKQQIKDNFDRIIGSTKGAYATLKESFKLDMCLQSERHTAYIDERDNFLDNLYSDQPYRDFKKLYLSGKNTFNQIKNNLTSLDQDTFDELVRLLKKEVFYDELFSDNLDFQEILNFHYYINEDTDFITMHKTKGSDIENIVVVLDEYFWSKYNFRSVFSSSQDLSNKDSSQKLAYVACSRAMKNLRCVRLVSTEEEKEEITSYFENVVEI